MTTELNEDFDVTLTDHIATLEIKRPPHNFLSNDLMRRIADSYEALDRNPECRAIVLCSEGKNFCAGGDYAPAQTRADGGEPPPLALDDFFTQVVRIFRCQTPVVAAIQGAAVGGGLGLAVSADFRVTCAEGRFSANFTRLGFNPGFGLVITLPALIGEQRASLMCLTSRRVKGEQAFAWGLADAFVELAQVRTAAHELAREIAACAPLAIASTRTTLRAGLADRIERQNEHDVTEQKRLRESHDWTEGVTAVAEGRMPIFTGR